MSNPTIPPTLGRRLAEARTAHAPKGRSSYLGVRDWAPYLVSLGYKVSVPMVDRYENDHAEVPARYLVAVAEVTGYRPDYLLLGREPKTFRDPPAKP